MEEKRTKLQVGSLLATGALFVIFLGVYLFQFTRPGPSSRGVLPRPTGGGHCPLPGGAPRRARRADLRAPGGRGRVSAAIWRLFREVRLCLWGGGGPHGRPLAITGGDGALVLECFYAGPGLPLLDGTGAPATDDGLTITAETAGESQTTLFSTPFTSLAQLAAGDNIHYRGSWQWFFFISVLAGLLSLTVAFPMTWFKLNHFLSVRDPEPSDFYLAMVKVEWVLVPVLLLIGYLWGLTLYT